jgi:hypothetical protein
MLAAFVGPRTSHSALTLISMTAAVVTGVPCFFSDGFSCYLAALVAVYSIIRSQSLRVLASADAPANL